MISPFGPESVDIGLVEHTQLLFDMCETRFDSYSTRSIHSSVRKIFKEDPAFAASCVNLTAFLGSHLAFYLASIHLDLRHRLLDLACKYDNFDYVRVLLEVGAEVVRPVEGS